MIAALAWAAPAGAAEILVLDDDGDVRVRTDSAVPRTVLPVPPRQTVRRPSVAAIATASKAVRRKRAKRRTVTGELRRLARRGALASEDHAARRSAWKDAVRRSRRLGGTRGTEMRAVVATIKDIAARRQLTASRVVPLWLTLERNLEWWTEGRSIGSGQRVEFEGSELVWQYYPGQGLQLQMLGNFGKLNALWSSKRRDTELAAMVDELLALAVDRAGGLAWEYYFTFNGGRAPWVSGMAQGTAVQSLSRAAVRLDRQADVLPVAQRALGIFEAPTPQGVRVPGEVGDHYALYSFAPSFRVINGFTQALVGLYDYAELSGDPRGLALFEAGDREARRELPTFDTGAWSLYSRGSLTRESDLSYHDLLTGFVVNLCKRTDAEVYCSTADRFREYEDIPPEIGVGTRTVRGGTDARVRFELSKISSVSLRITRGSRVIESRAFGTVGYGKRTFGWDDVPRRAGEYTVQISATDLAGNSASTEQAIEVLKPKRRKRP